MANYGFENSNEVELDKPGYPLGEYRVRLTEEEDVASGVKVTFKILSGTRKEEVGTQWYNTMSENQTVAKIAKQDLKRIGDATNKPVSKDAPLKGRIFCVNVTVNEKNPSFNNVRYLPADHIKEVEQPFA